MRTVMASFELDRIIVLIIMKAIKEENGVSKGLGYLSYYFYKHFTTYELILTILFVEFIFLYVHSFFKPIRKKYIF